MVLAPSLLLVSAVFLLLDGGSRVVGVALGTRRGRRMLIYSPAGIERFFLEAGAVTAESGVNLGALIEAAARYGREFLATPGAPG
jgi:FAD/FMN-containing dehydrogenase